MLVTPISMLFMYRDDRVEFFELSYDTQNKFYEVVKDFYMTKDWRLKLD